MTFTYPLGVEHGLYTSLKALQDGQNGPRESVEGGDEEAVQEATGGESKAEAPATKRKREDGDMGGKGDDE
jgi:hypothetical protein